jgi:hypothetical protein
MLPHFVKDLLLPGDKSVNSVQIELLHLARLYKAAYCDCEVSIFSTVLGRLLSYPTPEFVVSRGR